MMSHDPAVSKRLFTDAAKTAVALCFILVSAAVHGQSTAVSSVAPPTTVYDLEPLGKKPEADETKPLVDWLPIWGKAAQGKGFDLPLPMGLGLTYTYIHQNMIGIRPDRRRKADPRLKV